jgi:tetratricopeptide (TPR) repeat protein
LLGNYPAALVRASFEFLRDSETFFQSDSTRFEELRQKSLATLELARRFDPYFGPVVDLYPLLLVDKGYYEETFSFLDSLQGRVSPADEERSVTETIDYMRRIGQPDLAIEWLNRRIALQPDRKYFYSLLFTINQRLGRLEACQAVLDRWQARTGQVDTQLQAELDKLKAQAGDRP